MPGAGHSVVKVQGADSAGGVVRAMPQVVHTIVSQMPPNGVMAQPPHSPHYIQSPHPTTTYIPQHAMYQPPPMSQVPTVSCVYHPDLTDFFVMLSDGIPVHFASGLRARFVRFYPVALCPAPEQLHIFGDF